MNRATSCGLRWLGALALVAVVALSGCAEVSLDDEDNAPPPMAGRMRPNPNAQEASSRQ